MSTFSRIISFGASITNGTELPNPNNTWASIIAQRLNVEYTCLAKSASSNAGITREMLSYQEYKQDLVLVMWTSSTRYEFRNADSWENVNPWTVRTGAQTTFAKQWYMGPGKYEYTEVATTLRDLLLAVQFLESKKLPYLFTFDNNELRNSGVWEQNDPYISSMREMIPWDNIIWFDDTGFIDWSKQNKHTFINTHPSESAHQAAADYILSNRSFNLL